MTRSDAKDRFHSKTERQVRRLNLCRDHLLKVRDEGKLYRGSNGIPKVVVNSLFSLGECRANDP